MSPQSELDAARAFGRKEAIEEGAGSANVFMAELGRLRVDISKWQETALKMGFDGLDAAIAWGEDVARLRAELAEWTDTITAVLADVRGHRRCALYPHCEAGHAAAWRSPSLTRFPQFRRSSQDDLRDRRRCAG
jgi:hypothetical protein